MSTSQATNSQHFQLTTNALNSLRKPPSSEQTRNGTEDINARRKGSRVFPHPVSPFLSLSLLATQDDQDSSNGRSARQYFSEKDNDDAATILRPFGGLSRIAASMELPCETNDGR